MKVITNLNALALCPFQILYDIAEQLPEPSSALKETVFKPVCKLDAPDDWVKLDDSLGDLVAMRAYESSELVDNILKKHAIDKLEIHINLAGAPLTVDTFYALLFLSDLINAVNVVFYVLPEKTAQLQQATKQLTANEKITLQYNHAKYFLNDDARVETDRELATTRQQLFMLWGFTLNDLSDETINASRSNLGPLIKYAWACLKAGGYPLGCNVLEYLLAQPDLDDLVREELFVHLQVIRFLSHQHDKVVNHDFPEQFHYITDERITYLYFIKAFSATLTRNLSVAERCFNKAKIDLNLSISEEDSLYKLNLFALFHLMQGNIDTAFTIETQLCDYIKTNQIKVTPLKHVVLINIARLYKKTNELQKAAGYYEKAYAQINDREFTLFDSMCYEMDKAILYEMQQQDRKALLSWIKVAIYWLSCPNPYALALRPRLVLCQEKVIETLTPLSRDKVNAFLLEKINHLAVLAEMKEQESELSHFDFIPAETKNDTKKSSYVAEGMVIYGYKAQTKERKHSCTPVELALQRVVSRLVKTIMNIGKDEQILAIEMNHDCFNAKIKETQASNEHV